MQSWTEGIDSIIKMLKCILLVALIIVGRGDAKEAWLVNTDQGPVRGYKAPGDDVFVFYGIPYATAPTGRNKYKVPLPAPTWSEPFEAVNRNIVCPQMDSVYMVHPNGTQVEDCLVANIYVPDKKQDKLPVLAQVHGGGYQIGYGDFATAKKLMREKAMIIVNFNYRLGPHGFLCLGTPDAPGNAGMKDQVALLRWIQRNIASFGGNPEDVTINGASAGASAVDLLMLSPTTKGLFNKVVPESGPNLAAFSVQGHPLENAKRYAKMLNFTGDVNDVYALEEFYKTISKELLHSVNVMFEKDSTFLFTPCVERDIGEEMFLNDSPFNILKNGRQHKVPMLYGFAEMEGLIRIAFFDMWKDGMNDKFSEYLPGDLQFETEAEREKVADKVKRFYFGGQPINEETIFIYIDYFTDVFFAYGTVRSVRLQVESGNTNIYLYQYNFVDETAPYILHTKLRGADHCAQSLGVFDGLLLDPSEENLTEDFKSMKQMMRKMWASFITTGKPIPEGSDLPDWPPAKANGGPHMRIDKFIKLRGPLLQQRVLFWDEIYDKYYKAPSPPPTPPPRKKSEL
ncbi:PREDICTED: venom carboxylesterase-6-like [Papilio polytes]|uniref:venom carboxylesterase-6-like n=1 Tax=Papilio polytes TaxID=76194 RepID=UPI0006764D5F|nr:PREDICTED: venom carboxylesterase-6-like [Papilio polytes]